MNFIACDGSWLSGPGGELVCSGSLRTFTGEEMQSQLGSQLSWEDVHELKGEVIMLFCIAFGFLVLKKLF
ncbi:hypothetical protein ISG48_24960 [Pseudomonas aeruginosa]|nr:hypothetical protein [Pseudomonas aeruginosa]MBY9221944.1 hypothetical protein [Pseudomonas aeruginosa]